MAARVAAVTVDFDDFDMDDAIVVVEAGPELSPTEVVSMNSISIFDKLESAKGDLTELVMEEDVVDAKAVISEEVTAKLSVKQQELKVSRGEKADTGFGSLEFLDFDDVDEEKNNELSHKNLKLTAILAGGDASQTESVPLWAERRVQLEGGYCSTNTAVALHQEVMDLVDFLRPTRGEVAMRRLVELEIREIVKRLWPDSDCEVCVYGSMSTHLMLPLSDLDMTVLNVPVSTPDALTAICKEIGTMGLSVGAFPQLILKTKVPLVKYTHKLSGVHVDISVNAGDGNVNSKIVRSLIKDHPEAQYLIMVIKYFLNQRDFDEPFRGGMGSFTTTLLVISFLQHHPATTTDVRNRHLYGLGRLLVDFFRYYGNAFRYQQVGVSLQGGGKYFDRSHRLTDPNTNRPVQVVVNDPGNEENNVASSLRTFPSIATAFEFAYLAITSAPEGVVDASQKSPLAEMIELRPTLLSRILHVDPEMVRSRTVCHRAFENWKASTSIDHQVEVLSFRFDEDVDMWDPHHQCRVAKEVVGSKRPRQ